MPYYVKTCHLQKYTVKYASIAVHCVTLPHWYGNSCAIWNHAVLLPPGMIWDIPAFTQPKLVLDLATVEGCKAELM